MTKINIHGETYEDEDAEAVLEILQLIENAEKEERLKDAF